MRGRIAPFQNLKAHIPRQHLSVEGGAQIGVIPQAILQGQGRPRDATPQVETPQGGETPQGATHHDPPTPEGFDGQVLLL